MLKLQPAGSAVWFDVAPHWLHGSWGSTDHWKLDLFLVLMDFHGRNLQGKGQHRHDVPSPPALLRQPSSLGNKAVFIRGLPEDAGVMLFKKAPLGFPFWEGPQQGVAALPKVGRYF